MLSLPPCDSVDEERVLVEMACGAALAAVYSGVICRLQSEGNFSELIVIPLESHQHVYVTLIHLNTTIL